MASRYDTIVIGAGIGGLSAALRLARAGQQVLVLEQNPAVGGKMSELRDGGYRWDLGPSVITMRPVLEDLFAAAGRRLEDELDLVPVEPLTRYVWPDGSTLDATRDLSRMAAQIERLDPRDVEGYLKFLAYAARLHRVTGPGFIYGDPVSPATLLGVPPRDWLAVDGWRTMDQAIRSFVKAPRLRQLLGRFATYVGASPYQAPATLNVIAHVEMTGGVWYPRGGIYSIARALERLARESGVEIRTDVPVECIDVSNGRAVGVHAAGVAHQTRAVLANVDVATVYERLLPAALRRSARFEPSVSGFVLLLGLRGRTPGLVHHNLFFNDDYRAEFDDLFKRGRPPQDPTIYVTITSRTDPDDAPLGGENWFVLVNAPPLGPAWNWDDRARAYRDHVLSTLADRGFDVRDRIEVEHCLTPVDLERRTGARRGALYGMSSNSMWSAFRRPPNRSRDIKGLYFAGGTAHPGGGVPMVMLSGAAAARCILRDVGPR